jgi:hypothetical protein
VKATLDPEPTPDEKKLMKYEWNLEGAEPSDSLPHFALSDKGILGKGLVVPHAFGRNTGVCTT